MGSVGWDDCGWVFPVELRVHSFFSDRFWHYAWTAWSAHSWLLWVKAVCMFRCNLSPALLVEWPGSFMCHCSNIGVEQTLNKRQHRELTLEKKILLLFLPELRLATFQSWVWHSISKLPWLPMCCWFLILSTAKLHSSMYMNPDKPTATTLKIASAWFFEWPLKGG